MSESVYQKRYTDEGDPIACTYCHSETVTRMSTRGEASCRFCSETHLGNILMYPKNYPHIPKTLVEGILQSFNLIYDKDAK